MKEMIIFLIVGTIIVFILNKNEEKSNVDTVSAQLAVSENKEKVEIPNEEIDKSTVNNPTSLSKYGLPESFKPIIENYKTLWDRLGKTKNRTKEDIELDIELTLEFYELFGKYNLEVNLIKIVNEKNRACVKTLGDELIRESIISMRKVFRLEEVSDSESNNDGERYAILRMEIKKNLDENCNYNVWTASDLIDKPHSRSIPPYIK
jgi:hypothetical protein